jgi:hypothetical protein
MVAAVGTAVGGEQEEEEEEEEEEACTGCDVVESSSSSGGMRRVKRGTVYLRCCKSCALLYNKSMPSLPCYVSLCEFVRGFEPVVVVLPLRKILCMQSANTSSTLLLLLLQGLMPRRTSALTEASNGLSGSRSKVRSGGIIGVNCNSRMSRERLQLDDRDQADPSKSEKERQLQGGGGGAAASPKSKNLITIRKTSQGMPVTPHDAAAAAKFAAAQADKVALAAKKNAAAKASIAVKAAEAAKVALEAAAHAARAVAHAQAELQRKRTNSEPGLAESSSKLQLFVPPKI